MGVPHGSIVGPLLLIYINDLSSGKSSNIELFAGSRSIFTVVHDLQNSSNDVASKPKGIEF